MAKAAFLTFCVLSSHPPRIRLIASSAYVSSKMANATVDYSDALYFGWITATTVGYGFIDSVDQATMPWWTRPYIILQLLVSTSVLAGCISHFS